MAIKKILFPTKFDDFSYNSLKSLFVLRQVGLREIILFHVISREEVGFVPFGGYLKEEEERLREEARIRFEDWQKSLSAEGIESRIYIVVGELIHETLHLAEKERVDLIVIGGKKKAEGEHHFAGSDSFQIITRSKIPTLLSKYMVEYRIDNEKFAKTNDRIFEVPLLATDWSESSQRALELLISLNGIVTRALVFHNIDVKESKGHDERIDRIKEVSTECLDNYCKELQSSGINTEYHLGAGDTVQEILRISRERGATMIIMGTTGRGRLDEMFHGSVSHQITKMSELPTLLVP